MSDDTGKKSPGRKPFTPTAHQRQMVKTLAGYGMREPEICELVLDAKGQPISEKTLRKYFKRELGSGHVTANSKVADTLYRMATSGANVAATIFWMKTRARWRETDRLEITGGDADSNPVAVAIVPAKVSTPESSSGGEGEDR
ncbi:MAG: hypothetical protein RJA99_3137 [Pseudomonadota bacterium]|jgi:hypothetical protein